MSDTTDSQILRAASPDSDQWDDDTWAAWFRTAERAHGDGKGRRPLFNKVGELMARVTELEAEREKYVGKEPTVADEMAYLRSRLDAVRAVCDAAERDAARWEHPLAAPEWVAVVRKAANGEVATAAAS